MVETYTRTPEKSSHSDALDPDAVEIHDDGAEDIITVNITALQSSNYDKNLTREIGHENGNCRLCGKAIGDPDAAQWFREVDGGGIFTHDDTPESRIDPCADLGAQPVGPSCYRKNKKLLDTLRRPPAKTQASISDESSVDDDGADDHAEPDHGFDFSVLEDFDYFGLTVHPAADALPLMKDAALAEMALSILRLGLLKPIIMAQHVPDLVIDGRNRLRGLKLAGRTFNVHAHALPRAFMSDAEIIDYVEATNVTLRHLSDGQKVMSAARLYLERKRANLPPGTPRPTLKMIAAKLKKEGVKVSERQIKNAVALIRDGSPSLIRLVEDHDLAVSSAADLARAYSHMLQRQVIGDGETRHSGAVTYIKAIASCLRELGKLEIGDRVRTHEMIADDRRRFGYREGEVAEIFARGAGRGAVELACDDGAVFTVRLDQLERIPKQQPLAGVPSPTSTPDPAPPGAPGGDDGEAPEEIQRQIIGEKPEDSGQTDIEEWTEDGESDPRFTGDPDAATAKHPYDDDGDDDAFAGLPAIGSALVMLTATRGPRLTATGPMVSLAKGDAVIVTGHNRDELTGSTSITVRRPGTDWDFTAYPYMTTTPDVWCGFEIGSKVRYIGAGIDDCYAAGDVGIVEERGLTVRGPDRVDVTLDVSFDDGATWYAFGDAARQFEIITDTSAPDTDDDTPTYHVGDKLYLSPNTFSGVVLSDDTAVEVVGVRVVDGEKVYDIKSSLARISMHGLPPWMFRKPDMLDLEFNRHLPELEDLIDVPEHVGALGVLSAHMHTITDAIEKGQKDIHTAGADMAREFDDDSIREAFTAMVCAIGSASTHFLDLVAEVKARMDEITADDAVQLDIEGGAQ